MFAGSGWSKSVRERTIVDNEGEGMSCIGPGDGTIFGGDGAMIEDTLLFFNGG